MDFRNLFKRKQPIAGIAITDTSARLVLLTQNDKTALMEIAQLTEVELPANTIANGIITDQNNFTRSLKDLRSRLSKKLEYVILSIPTDLVYSKVYSFPKTIQNEKLTEAINLAVNFQLPLKPDLVYTGWETIKSELETDILLAAAQKSVVETYITCLRSAGFHPVAIESHPLSFARAVRLKDNERIIVILPNAASNSICVYKNGKPEFCRVINNAAAKPKQRDSEINKIVNYIESEKGPVAAVASLEKAPVTESFANDPKLKDTSGKWYVALGAAVRGLSDRSKDTDISLMPLTSKQAFEYQHAISFAGFWGHLVTGVAIFFAVSYVSVWLFIASIQAQTNNQVQTLSVAPPAKEDVGAEDRVKSLNELIALGNTFLINAGQWSKVIEELRALAGTDITVTGLNTANPADPLTISGTSAGRDDLNAFKKRLEESKFFTEVKLPLTNLEQKEKIPFSITLKLKDPNLITYQ